MEAAEDEDKEIGGKTKRSKDDEVTAASVELYLLQELRMLRSFFVWTNTRSVLVEAWIAKADKSVQAMHARNQSYRLTKHDVEFRRECVRQFFKDVPTGKCANCKDLSPQCRST